jgi:hypothetical protein
MDWFFNSVLDWLVNDLPAVISYNWAKIVGTILFMFGGAIYIWCKRKREWWTKQFYGVVNVSFDVVRDHKLLTSALLEDKLEDAFSSLPHIVGIIVKAAKKTTEQEPFLIFPKADRWHVMSQILAVIAETNKGIAWGAVAEEPKSVAVPCHYAVTYERSPKMKAGKIRIIVVPDWVLEDRSVLDNNEMSTEYSHHADRIMTLRQIREDVLSDKKTKFSRAIRIFVPA